MTNKESTYMYSTSDYKNRREDNIKIKDSREELKYLCTLYQVVKMEYTDFQVHLNRMTTFLGEKVFVW